MDFFTYKNGELYCEEVPAAVLAEKYGTPLYVYSTATLLRHYRQVAEAFAELSPTICYSIKSSGNVHICRLLAEQGCGFDVTSGGELYRALLAGGDPGKIIFAGVGKTDEEIRYGLETGIAAFNIESEAEIENIDRIAGELRKTAMGALRVNPDVDPGTHAYTATGKRQTKFGVDLDRAERVFDACRGLGHLRLAGLHMHLGSPIYRVEPYVEATRRINIAIDRLRERGHRIEWFDIGGGFGASYEHPEQALPVGAFAEALVPLLRGRGFRVAVEPGRYIAGNGGILLARVLYRKTGGDRKFVITDAAMNDLLRPALYGSFHFIWPARHAGPLARDRDQPVPGGERVDVVGPICESGDFLAQDRMLPPMQRGDLLAVFTAGAYGFSMSSNYNNRPRAAEVLVEGGNHRLIRRRETWNDLVAAEEVVS